MRQWAQSAFAPAGAAKYTPCPNLTSGPSTTTTATTDPLTFAYTETDPYGVKTAVIACETSSVEDIGGLSTPVTVCAGRRVVVTGSTQFPIMPTLRVTAAQATSTYVGSLTGSTLYSSVTSALSNILPSKAAATNYKGATVAISGIEYPDPLTAGIAYGDLEITVDWAQFQNGSIHDKMIEAAGRLVNQTLHAQGACKDKTYPFAVEGARGGATEEKTWRICQVAGAYELEYFDGVDVDGPVDQLVFTMAFQGSQAGEDITAEVCDTILTAIDFLAALAAVFFPPAYLVDENVAKDLVQAGCGVAKDIQNGIHHVTSALGN